LEEGNPITIIFIFIYLLLTQADSQCPVTFDCINAPFMQCGKKLKLSSDGGNSGSKKCKRGYGGAYGGVWRSLRLAGVCCQAVGFVLVRLAGIWLQSP
jgi:hypothetical protein